MEPFFIYLIKSASILALFFLAYKFLLQKETFFHANRHYLLGGILAALLLPLVVFTSYVYVDPIPIQDVSYSEIPFTINEIPASEMSIAEASEPFNWYRLLFNIYVLGVLLVGIRFAIQLFSLHRLIRKGLSRNYHNYKLIEVNEDLSPFSFFNYIVYNPSSLSDSDLKIILNHEKAHSNQLHSIDILIAQLLVIFQWFNPIVWFYKKTIQQNLEFLADKAAISKVQSKKNYQRTLLKVSVAPYCTSITNNFYNSLIKKRIVMLNQTSSNKRNLWKYGLILPVLACFIMSFNTKTVEILKDPLITEFTIEPTSTKKDLNKIERHFKSNNDVMLKFNDLKRNDTGKLTSISINTKYKKNNRFMKRLTFKAPEGKDVIDVFKLNYDKTENSFLLSRGVTAVPESKIMEHTIKLLADISISEIPSKTTSSLGDNPLYIINGKKVKSNALPSEEMSLDGEIIQLSKEEGTETYGEEGSDGVLVFNGITSFGKQKENKANDIIATITKDTTKEELDALEKDLRAKDVTFSYSNVDFNSSNEIISIKIQYKNKSTGNSGSYHVNGDDDEPIKPIYLFRTEKGGMGLGTSPDGKDHSERMTAHKAKMKEHKEKMYEHKLKMKEHNAKVKEEHKERMEEHRSRMEERKEKMEEEHEVRIKEMKVRQEEMHQEREERMEEHRGRLEEQKERMEERRAILEEDKARLLKEREERRLKGNADSFFVEVDDDNYEMKLKSSNGKTPLFIVDGEEQNETYAQRLTKNNKVASINVLKGKAASVYGNKGKDGVIVIKTKDNQSQWKVSYGVKALDYDKESKNEKNMFLVSKTSTNKDLTKLKEKLSNSNIDFSYSRIKRNKQGEITRIKITLDNNKGSKSSSSYNTGDEGIPDIWVGKTNSGKVTLLSSN